MKAEEIIETLDLIRHPNGGWYTPSFRAGISQTYSDISSIYYLLTDQDDLPLRKLTAHEVWHFYDGAPVEMEVERTKLMKGTTQILGRDLAKGQRPQVAIPAYYWQRARTLGEWSLVGCDVAPGYTSGRTQMASEAQ